MADKPIFDPDSEQAVIATVLRRPEQYRTLKDIIQPDHFYWRAFGWVWEAFGELQEHGTSIDIINLADELQRHGRLDEFRLPGIRQFSGTPALSEIKDLHTLGSGESYAVNVQDYAAKRKLLNWLSTAAGYTHNGRRAADIVAELEHNLETLILHSTRTRSHVSASPAAAAMAYDAARLASKGNRDFPTGLLDLDKLLGILKTELITVAGRPGQGKSALLQSISLNAADAGRRVKFYSLEMSLVQVTQRFIAQLAEVNAFRLMQGRLTNEEWEKIEQARDKFAELPIIICDQPAISIGQIRTDARREDIDAIVVDYVQLARPDRHQERRDLDIGEVTMGLKALGERTGHPDHPGGADGAGGGRTRREAPAPV